MAGKKWPINGLEAYVTTDDGYRVTTSFIAGRRCITYFKITSPDGRVIRMGSFPSHLNEPSFGDLDHAWTISEGDMRQDMVTTGMKYTGLTSNIKATDPRVKPGMKKYAVYFECDPYDAMTCMAKNKTEARQIGNLYNRQWDLHTKILRIEEVE